MTDSYANHFRSFSFGISATSSTAGSGMSSRVRKSKETIRHLCRLRRLRALLMAIRLIQAYREPSPLYLKVSILSSAWISVSSIRSFASSSFPRYRLQSVFSLTAYLLYSSSSAILSFCEQYLASACSSSSLYTHAYF